MEQDDEDFKFFGTPIEDETETRVGQYRKDVRDAAATRALPLHKQEVTDEQGRRRFHGAFTGGFSAGYFNTVGSKEGWQPSTFRSSRSSRASVQQSVEQFYDEDELEELRKTNLQTTGDYDTFGSTAAELARRAASEAAAERPSAIPGLLPDEIVAPVAEGVGIRLLQKMGWRQGKGIGVGGDAPTAADEEAEEGEEGGEGQAKRRRRWGQHVTVAADNTALYLLAPKTDVHGLGYDPFKGAEDFRKLKEAARQAQRPDQGQGAEAKKRRRGIAFGSGVLDEDDGLGIMDDYVTHDDVDSYEEVDVDGDDGLPRSRAPKVQKSGLGDRLARRGYNFEIMEEEDEEPGALGWHPTHPHHHRQQQYALPGREAPLLLQSREQQVKNSLVPGFVRATAVITLAYFPPPRVPPGYVPLHRPSRDAEAALPAAASKFAPPQAEPPADAALRQAIDSLAFFVARNGVVFENMARQRQQKEGRFAFLSGGEGAAYYRWKVHSLKSIIAPQQAQQGSDAASTSRSAIGRRSAPLSADERGALLGEAQLPASHQAQQGWAAGVAGAGAAGAAGAGAGGAAAGEAPQLRRQLMQVAEADRQRLQQMLTRSFVAAESQDMLHPDAAASAAAGLRPGAPAPPPRPPAGPATGAAAGGAAKVITEADLSRPVDLSSSAGPAPGGGLALRQPDQQPGQQPGQQQRLPVRRSEEWRPVPLLCKRFNVPDPYQGRPAELQMSKFRTDHLILPDTAAAVAASLNAVPAGAQEFLLPPTVASAIKEAEAAQQAQQLGPAGAGVPVRLPPQQPQQLLPPPQDAAGAADAFLSSLSGMLGGGDGSGAAGAAPPLPPDPAAAAQQAQQRQQQDEVAAAEADRPVDLFKAIFEDSEEEQEEEEEEDQEADATAQQQQQQREQQLAPLPAGGQADHQQQQQQGRLTVVDDDGGRLQQAQQPQAQQAQQPQAQQAQQRREWDQDASSFGFAKLRQPPLPPQQPPLPPLPPGPPPPGAGVPPAATAAGAIDDALKQRVQDALRALKKDKKEKRSSRKKERKEKKKKGGSKEKDKKRRHDRKDRKKKSSSGRDSKHRRRSDSDSSSSSGSDSGSD